MQVEHAFGILKGRFSSLRGLWVGHIEKEDQLRAAVWIRCCVLLHNLILEEDLEPDDAQWLRDGTETVNNDDKNTQNQPREPHATSRLARDHPRRIQLMRDMFLEPPRPSAAQSRGGRGTQASGRLFNSSLATILTRV